LREGHIQNKPMSRKATETAPPNSELEVTFSLAILEMGHFESPHAIHPIPN